MRTGSLRVLASIIIASTAFVVPVRASPIDYADEIRESFATDAGLGAPGDWIVSGDGQMPCLTALTSETPLATVGDQLPQCDGAPDPDGTGALRLTEPFYYRRSRVEYSGIFSANNGVAAHFYIAAYGGNNYEGKGADGISFYLTDSSGDPATLGVVGGSLGYTGIPGALFGVGFDVNGNFSTPQSIFCDGNPGQRPHSIVVRGGDTSPSRDGYSGYCYLGGTTVTPFNGASRADSAREVLVTVDPVTRSDRMINVYFGPVGDLPNTPTLSVPVTDEYLSASSLRFGFSAATGLGTNIHEVWGLSFGSYELSYEFLGCGLLSVSVCPTISSISASSVQGAPGMLHVDNRATYRWLRCRAPGLAFSASRLPAGCTVTRTTKGTAAQFASRPYTITSRDRSAGYLRLAVTVGSRTYYSAARPVAP